MNGPIDPADDPELRWANMRLMEEHGQMRLPLPGVKAPSKLEHEVAAAVRKARK